MKFQTPLFQSKAILKNRWVPKDRLDDPRWMRLLSLENPPENSLYVPRKLIKQPSAPSPMKKKAKIITVKELANLATLAKITSVTLGMSGLSTPSVKSTAAGVRINEPPTTQDWNKLSPDVETALLGLENLQSGDTIVIVGAGISGLVFAWFLCRCRPDVNIRILEKGSKVGGWMRSEDKGCGVLYESGPRTLLPSHAGTTVICQMLAEMNKLDCLWGVPKSAEVNNKALFYDGKITTMPRSLLDAAKFIISSPLIRGTRWAILKDLWTAPRSIDIDDETVQSFVSRRMGSLVSDRIISALMRGIYAGSAAKLSARSAVRLNKLYYLERTEGMSILAAALSGSVSYLDAYAKTAFPIIADALLNESKLHDGHNSNTLELPIDSSAFSILGFPAGMESFPNLVASDLRKRRNVSIELNESVRSIEPVGRKLVRINTSTKTVDASIVVTTIADSSMFGDAELKRRLDEIEYANVAVVNVSTPEPIAQNMFGVLVPASENARNKEGVIGIIFDSSVKRAMTPVVGSVRAAMEAPAGTVMTVMIGGDLWEEMSEQEAIDRALRGIEKILGPFDRTKVTTKLTLQRRCIPQCTVGHSIRVHEIHELLSRQYGQRAAAIGTALGRGIGVSDCVIDAMTLALRFAPQRTLVPAPFFFGNYFTTMRPEYYA